MYEKQRLVARRVLFGKSRTSTFFMIELTRKVLTLILTLGTVCWSNFGASSAVYAHHDQRTAEALPDELIVMPKEPGSIVFTEKCFTETGCTILRTIKVAGMPMYLVKTPAGKSPEVEERLRRFVYHVHVQKNYKVYTQAGTPAPIPNDPFLPQQWHLGGLGVNSVKAWNLSRGRGVTVAVIDTGCVWSMPELVGRSHRNYNAALDRWDTPAIDHHGTMVATTLVANSNNKYQGASVAPLAVIQPIQVCDLRGDITEYSVLAGMVYAADRNIRIMNLSLNIPKPATFSNATVHPIFHSLAEWYHNKKNGLLFLASGNDMVSQTWTESADFDYSPRSPYVMNVTGYGKFHIFDHRFVNGFPTWWAGPAVDIVCTDAGNRVVRIGGTSVATACVTGVAALLLSAKPGLSNTEVEEIMKRNAFTFFHDRLPSNSYGWGVPDAQRCLQAVLR